MKINKWIIGAMAAVALMFAATPAEAHPWRGHYGWHRGYYHGPVFYGGPYYNYGYPYGYGYYPYGGYYGPGVSVSFGFRGGHHW